MSFNVSLDLAGFQTIVPCGLVGEPVASLKTILGNTCPTMPLVRDALLNNFSAVCNRNLERFDAEGDLPGRLKALICQ
jgi:lipoate-protein ligase B